MKTALIHDWLTSAIGGGENVLQVMHSLFPSPIFTLLYDEKKLQGSYFQDLEIHSSLIQKLPFANKLYRNYLPLFPYAIRQFSFDGFDLLLSSSHCVAKGLVKTKDQLHICYCHTPMRYAWDLMDVYLTQKKALGLKRLAMKQILKHLRAWDVRSSTGVDHFIANSHFVEKRIATCYGRSSEVIYPPVDTDFFTLESAKEDFYVTASRLVQNKRIDLIVDAFAEMQGKKLYIIGDGPEKSLLEKKATPNITFLGSCPRETVRLYLQKAKAFVFAAIEDFGIAPVEAMAAGTPVIALGQGGVLETVTPETGILYPDQTIASLKSAIKYFEITPFDPIACHLQASKFSAARFRRQFQTLVLHRYEQFNKNR
jgi:glycosyltransferase involved in cell wall biosynthesis